MTPSFFLWTQASDPQSGLPASNQHSDGTWEVFKKWGLLCFVWGTLCSELQEAGFMKPADVPCDCKPSYIYYDRTIFEFIKKMSFL